MTERLALALIALLCLTRGAGAAKPIPPSPRLSHEEAKARIIRQDLPAFWSSDIPAVASRVAQIAQGRVTTIAQSPGGRPLFLVAYGELEPAAHHANYNSAIGGEDAAAYLDKQTRKKPVILFVGPVHGQEVEGLTGLMNLIEVLETGRDLRGKPQPALRELAAQCRLLIIPSGNPDGVARFEPRTMRGLTVDDLNFWGQGTWSDGSIAEYPVSKRQHPWAGPRVGFRGCYYDDAGVNAMHDEFFAPLSTAAPAILRVAREEGPDLAVSLHSHGNLPQILRPAYTPLEVQADVAKLTERFAALCAERKLPCDKPQLPKAEEGPKRPPSIWSVRSTIPAARRRSPSSVRTGSRAPNTARSASNRSWTWN